MTPSIDIGTFQALLTQDRELTYTLRGLSRAIARIDGLDKPLDIIIADGRIVRVRPAEGSADLVIAAPPQFWQRYLSSPLTPGDESLTLAGRHGVVMRGDERTLVAPYHPAWSRLYELVRVACCGPLPRRPSPGEPFAATDNAVGRYTHVTVDGISYRVFYEQSGTGAIPLLLQHTAGGDGRQWRHQLADPEIQKRFTVIAYDLPYHGRSVPPSGAPWWEHPYLPTQEWLMTFVVSFAQALKLDRPMFMGCSVGGQLALDLAVHHPDNFRALIALNGWHNMEPMRDFTNDRFRTPGVSENWYASLCQGGCGPLAPENPRREIYWIYRSNFPGVYAGDNDYFMSHDMRGIDRKIPTDRVPVYALSGEFDSSSEFEDCGGQAVARDFPGVVYRTLPGLSHFAPTDDPIGFREQIIPIFDEILEKCRAAA